MQIINFIIDTPDTNSSTVNRSININCNMPKLRTHMSET